MRTVQITCDGCGNDLTTRTNSVDYRLVLASESKPGYGSGAYTDMMICPPVERTHHFCGLDCLDHWRARENFKAALWRANHARWRREKGREYAPGHWSYPSMSRDEREEVDAKFTAAALAAFPIMRPRQTTPMHPGDLGIEEARDA